MGFSPLTPTSPTPLLSLAITEIGTGGDGVAPGGFDKPIHVARTLPGERVQASPEPFGRARLMTILEPSAERIAPPCPHFAHLCGGCALQHWADTAYAAWKRGLVIAALSRAGYANPHVGPLIRTPPAARRRMDFAAQRRDGHVVLGLHQAHAKSIIDISLCPILHPALLALLAPLRALLSSLGALRRDASILANLLDTGPDLLIRTDGPLAATDRAKLADFARAQAIPRIAWARDAGPIEIAAQLAAPSTSFAGTRVEIPPGAFLQASAIGEAAIVSAVLAALPARRTQKSRAIELFAGCGTLSLPLAAELRVQAYEGDAAAAAALRRAQSNTRLDAIHRDLARQPLSAKELAGAALVVLDPPYAGAAQQMPSLAASGVKRIIYVSCNPAALARDAAVLRQSGFSLALATPIDQFLWSAQVETVAVFDGG